MKQGKQFGCYCKDPLKDGKEWSKIGIFKKKIGMIRLDDGIIGKACNFIF